MLTLDIASFQSLIQSVISTSPIHKKNGSEMISNVWKFTFSNKLYALKISQPKSQAAANRLAKEQEFIRALDHPQIVKYTWHGNYIHQTNKFKNEILITEWIPGVILNTTLQQKNALFNSLQELNHCIEQLQSILDYMHLHKIQHRDLWSKNIIINKGLPYIFDFGWACYTYETMPYTPAKMQNPDDKSALKKINQELQNHYNATKKNAL